MSDLSVNFNTFSATQCEIAAVSQAAKQLFAELFGIGAVSVTMPKSQFQRFAEFAQTRGLSV